MRILKYKIVLSKVIKYIFVCTLVADKAFASDYAGKIALTNDYTFTILKPILIIAGNPLVLTGALALIIALILRLFSGSNRNKFS